MRAAIVSDNIITNIIVLQDGADPAAHGALQLPEGKWIGDQYTEPSTPPTLDDKVAALEAENKLLRAQMSAQSDQLDFYEDCIAEMAAVVYA